MFGKKYPAIKNSNQLPLLLLPGSLCNEQLFKPQINFLRQSRDLYVADLTCDDTIELMAEHALQLFDGKFDLLGLSMGGIVAFEVYRQAAQRVNSLILVDTNYLPETPDNKTTRLQQIQEVRDNGILQIFNYIDDIYYPKYVSIANLTNITLKNCVIEMAKISGVNAFINQWHALAYRDDSTKTLSDITCPTLIICGAEDAMCSVEKHQFMHQNIKGSTLKVIPNCGHLSTLEKPDDFNNIISEWFSLNNTLLTED
ncbi:alpha/beta fold hydrolase [Cysteiniphilum halobium]|uniref:alpha/beta fold hydrolase n=1 Tax=Cysteiniphilum halobium TaxID=2219059 RepID=UPI003F82D51E